MAARRGARGGASPPPPFLNQTEARRAAKIFLETVLSPPPTYLRDWMTAPFPPPLISRSGSGAAWCYLTLRYLGFLSNFGPKVTVGSDKLKGIDQFPSLISKWLLQTLEKQENYRKAKREHECAKVKMINCVRCVLSVITSILTDNVTWTCRGLFQPKITSTSLLQLKVFSRITSDLLWI